MGKAMVRVEMILARPGLARAGTEYHISLFWAMGRAQKAKVGHVGGLGHGKGNGQR